MNKEADLSSPFRLTRRKFLEGLAGIIPYPLLKKPEPPTPQPPSKEQKEVSFTSSVLYYHEVTRGRITSDIIDLIKRGFQPLSLDAFIRTLNGDVDISSDPTFIVTFDDSRLSQYTQGLPAIDAIEKQMGIIIPVTFFGIVGFSNVDGIDYGPNTIDKIPDETTAFYDGAVNKYMNKAQLIQVLEWGHSIQNHTINHPYLTRVSSGDLINEIRWGESRVDELWKAAGRKRSVRAFAYPYGAFRRREQDYLASFGYDVAFSTMPTTSHTTAQRFRLGRLRRT